MMVKPKLLSLFPLLWILGGALSILPAAAFHVTNPAEITRLQHLVDNNKLDEADQQIANLLNHYPDNPELRFLEALVTERSGDTVKAIALYQQLIENQPGILEPYNNLALLQAKQGDYRTAVDTLERGIGTNPGAATVYANLTALFGRLAAEAYQKALDSDTPVPPLELTIIDEMDRNPCHCATDDHKSMPNRAADQAPAVDLPEATDSADLANSGTDPSGAATEMPDPAD